MDRKTRTTDPPVSMPAGAFLTPLAAHLGLKLVTGKEGLQKRITSPRVQKPGLPLAGFLESLRSGRVQVLGESEISYLAGLTKKQSTRSIQDFFDQDLVSVIVTKDLDPPAALVQAAGKTNTPLFRTRVISSVLISGLQEFLENQLAQKVCVHAVFMDLFGLGVLILGDSGVGKSELGLELISRGHRLISDDIVEILRRGDTLSGSGPELTRYHMELRGIGIINIKDLFGVASVRYRKDIDMVVRLDPWQEGKEYDRLGIDERTHQVLGMDIPFIEIPVAPGRNLAIILEVAARNHLLKLKGYYPARELAGRVDESLLREDDN